MATSSVPPKAAADKSPPPAFAGGWRRFVKVHPAAELFPLLPPAELQELGASIKRDGMISPIVFWFPGADPGGDADRSHEGSKGFLLDGRNRLDAMEAAGLPTWSADGRPSEVIKTIVVFEGGRPNGAPGVDPHEYVVAANIRRRHLSTADKQELIAKLLKAAPERSDRATAELVKVDHKTVGAVREKLVDSGEIPQLKRTVGRDGRARTARPQRTQLRLSDTSTTIPPSRLRLSDTSTPGAKPAKQPEHAPPLNERLAAAFRGPPPGPLLNTPSILKGAAAVEAASAQAEHDRAVQLLRSALQACSAAKVDFEVIKEALAAAGFPAVVVVH